ncbi:MAG: YciI family protein [Gemmatimonadales bacterium]
MRFMMLMIPKDYGQAGAAARPTAEAVAAMTKFNAEMIKAGVMLTGEGLHPPAAGVRIAFGGGQPKVTDGPFAEAKELIGGYWMIQARSKEEAVEWARRCPAAAGDVIEIRQIFEMDDFPPDVRAAIHPA